MVLFTIFALLVGISATIIWRPWWILNYTASKTHKVFFQRIKDLMGDPNNWERFNVNYYDNYYNRTGSKDLRLSITKSYIGNHVLKFEVGNGGQFQIDRNNTKRYIYRYATHWADKMMKICSENEKIEEITRISNYVGKALEDKSSENKINEFANVVDKVKATKP